VTCTPIFYRAAIVQDVDGSSRLPDEEAAKRPPASSNDQAELPLAATPKMPGRTPGVMALDIIDNVVPYIPKEEEKVEKETQKILGRVVGNAIEPAAFPVSATCTRVPVLEGHTEAVYVSMERAATVDEVKIAMRSFGAGFVALGLPSAPSCLIDVSDDPFRPQPRLDRDRYGGMLTAVGRLRRDHALANGVKYMLVSHNTKMGAAKGAILVAEYLARHERF